MSLAPSRMSRPASRAFFTVDRALTDEDVAYLFAEKLNALEPGVDQKWKVRESTSDRVHFDLSFGNAAPRSTGKALVPARSAQPLGFARALVKPPDSA